MDGRERIVFTLLSGLALFAIATFAVVWLRAIAGGPNPVLAAIATALIAAQLAVWGMRWAALPRMIRPVPEPIPEELRVAAVTTFVATHEPLDMLELTLRAMLAMHGEHDTWLLDEGNDDETRALCERLGVRHFTRRGIPEHNTPDGTFRAGSKHGNYNAWLATIGYAEYDVLVAFDPDHVPEPEYLARTLGYFRDPSVAFVQPPQVYYNPDASFIARGAAEETYAYYSSHLMASYALGHAVVIGSHGAHRLAALGAVGGLPAHDAEDLYLTMLYRAAGWRGVFVPEILAAGVTPADWFGYLKQQLRWSRSLIDLKLRVFPRLAGRLGWVERALNLMHGVYYLRALLLPVGFAMLALLMLVDLSPHFIAPRPVAAVVGLLIAIGCIDTFRQRYYLDPRERGLHWRAVVMQLAKWPVFVLAVWEAVHGRRPPYAITRKAGPPNRRWVLAKTQIPLAGFIGFAWIVGRVRNGALHPTLTAAAALTVITALVLAWTETWPRPSAYVPGAYQRWRAGLRSPT